MKESPTGKVPYADLGPILDSPAQTRWLISDSTLITKKLAEMGKLSPLAEKLTLEQQGIAMAVRALLEDRLYFYIVSPPRVHHS